MADTTKAKRTHQCPGAGCRVEVAASQLACRSHWFSLPREVRDRVNRVAITEAIALLDAEGGEE
jgi:hypothetical protein